MTLTIRGRVQGVFYRHTARIHAARLGVTGSARNEPDGSVVIIAEGEPEALKELLAWSRTGPPLAAVESVTVDWGEAAGTWKHFEIQ